jgi:hypothetical protein
MIGSKPRTTMTRSKPLLQVEKKKPRVSGSRDAPSAPALLSRGGHGGAQRKFARAGGIVAKIRRR